MTETNLPSEPAKTPVSADTPPPVATGSEEGKPLSALEAYRKERAEMFAARVKKFKDIEAMKEAVKTASKTSALVVPRSRAAKAEVKAKAEAEAKAETEVLAPSNGAALSEAYFRQAESQTVPRPPERKLQKTLLSIFVFIGLPVIVVAIYYGMIASDQFAATASFSIHSNNPSMSGSASSPSGLANLLAGGGNGGAGLMAILGEMFVVQDYVGSQQLITDIKPHLDLRAIYSRPQADYLARLSPKANDKDLLAYWRSMVQVQVDNNTGIGQLTVKAFTAQDSKDIADEVLKLSEGLVNKMSERSQKDTIKLAQDEVDSASARVLKAHQALNAFFAEQGKPTTNPLPATETLSERDRLQQELNFAEQAYGAALTTRQSATAVAMVRSLYLEPFVQPQVADIAEFPSRTQAVILTFLVASLLWVLGVIIVAATREHL